MENDDLTETEDTLSLPLHLLTPRPIYRFLALATHEHIKYILCAY